MRWYFLHLIHRKRSPFPSRGRLWQCAVCRSSDLRVQITQRSHPAFSGCFFPMTCFRRKEGIFALTAQQLGCRVPVLHRIPLFSQRNLRSIGCSCWRIFRQQSLPIGSSVTEQECVSHISIRSRICHKISRVLSSPSSDGGFLFLNTTPVSTGWY